MYGTTDPNKYRKPKKSSGRSSHKSASQAMKDYVSALVNGGVAVQGGSVAPVVPQTPQVIAAMQPRGSAPKLDNGLSAISFKEAERNAEMGAGGGPADPSAAAADPMDALVKQLYGLANSAGSSVSGPSGLDIKKMLSGAGAAGAPYSAQIASLQHMNTGARQDTNKGTKAIQRMYKALAMDDASAGAGAVATQKQLAADINRQAAEGNTQNQQRAQALMADNAKYGGDVAAQLNSGIAKQATQNQGITTQHASAQAAAALQQGGNFNNYFQQNRSADNLEGSKRASDLITQLQGYLQGNRDKMAELAGQKSAAVSSARNSILSQITGAQQNAQKAAYGASQDRFANLLNLMKFQSDRQNQGIDNDRAAAQLQMQLNKYSDQQTTQQQRAAQQGQLSTADLIKLLSSNGVYKGKSQNDIMAAIQAIMSSSQ